MRTPYAFAAALCGFVANRAGGVAMTAAVAAPVALAAGGIALDYASLSRIKSRLQAIADTAAVAGARELSLANRDAETVEAAAIAHVDAQANAGHGAIARNADADLPGSRVDVFIEQQWTPVFAGFLNSSITPVKVSASAKLVTSTKKICVLTLDPGAGKSLHLDQDASLSAAGCGVFSNSGHRQSIRVDRNGTIKAAVICAVGGAQYNRADSVKPAPLTDCPPVPDPLAAREPPAVGSCDENDLRVETGNVTLNPGVYCGGITVRGDAVVRFAPGTYVVKDGPFTISGEASVTGDHAGFYLTGNDAKIEFRGDTHISMTGPASGPLAGLLFFEDRGAPAGRGHRITSAHANKLEGTVYLSQGKLAIDPNAAVADESAYTAIVVRNLELTAGPDLVLNTDYGASDVPVPEGISGKEQVVLAN